MKFDEPQLDAVDRQILEILQDDCKTPLARIGQLVGLSAPSVVERIRKLESAGVVRGYHAVLSARHIGLDVTAFIGVSINYPKMIGTFEHLVGELPHVLECHHVTGEHTLLLKVKTRNTASLEEILSRIRSAPGVERTHTMVVLSTQAERTRVEVDEGATPSSREPRGGRARRAKRPDERSSSRAAGHDATRERARRERDERDHEKPSPPALARWESD